MCLLGCAATVADLRDRAADLPPADALRLAGEAFDVWHSAALARATSEADIDVLADADRHWLILHATATRALRLWRADPATQSRRWREALSSLLDHLRTIGAL